MAQAKVFVWTYGRVPPIGFRGVPGKVDGLTVRSSAVYIAFRSSEDARDPE